MNVAAGIRQKNKQAGTKRLGCVQFTKIDGVICNDNKIPRRGETYKILV